MSIETSAARHLWKEGRTYSSQYDDGHVLRVLFLNRSCVGGARGRSRIELQHYASRAALIDVSFPRATFRHLLREAKLQQRAHRTGIAWSHTNAAAPHVFSAHVERQGCVGLRRLLLSSAKDTPHNQHLCGTTAAWMAS
eukprot:CAMPEP_0176448186 /NCGR_PEP_ID=MMETSP0127-20121128/25600_1 /TAXON_ID=938130 /ORGANISM="Platyophrya macrostoma, Strain WH" /LENGTH=138 /DNA_ID=CAMNT_0017835021 /DNA_START=566 /DNA_END=979 /DNA_ORIENTATION=+